MSSPKSSLPITYLGALREYLARPDEENLEQAYELGRAAMSAGLGVFDIIRLHHQALSDGLLISGPSSADPRLVVALEIFLLEVLSPFEAAHRGFRTALERLEHVNGELNSRNEELATSNAQLQELSARVLTAQEEERKRISRELHDEIGQALTAVNVTVAMLKKQAGDNAAFQRKVAEAERLLAQSMETVHCFARELRPAMLDHLGVHAALRAHVNSYVRRTGLRVDLGTHADLARVQGQPAEVLFRIAQESLSNVFKHAQATRVKIDFASDGLNLSMEVADNGKAFAVEEKLGKRTGRLGLLGMQERVRLVNGKFMVESAPGQGTRVIVRVPLDAAAAASALSIPNSTTPNHHEENICVAG
ncbi:MAG TPA: histidine kinase [Opitutaceae bacterium]|jgi:signal transduction histidine kinase